MSDILPSSRTTLNCWKGLLLQLICILFNGIGFIGVGAPIHSLTWTPEGDAVLLDQGSAVYHWQLDECSIQSTPWITTSWKTISAIKISPDGLWVALGGGVAGETGAVNIYNRESRQLIQTTETFSDMVTSLAWTSDSQQIAIGAYDHSIRILQQPTSPPTRGHIPFALHSTLTGHSRAVLDLCFASDDRHLISCGSDRSIKVWNMETSQPIRSLSNHTDRVLALSSRPTQHFNDIAIPFTCASASDDQTVRIWQPVIGRMVRIVRDHEATVLRVDWDPSGKFVYSADTNGVIRKIDGNSDRILAEIETGLDWIHALSVSPDGTRLANADWKGNIQVWKISAESNELSLTHSLSVSMVQRHE